MITVTKEPITDSDRQKLKALLNSPGWLVLLDCIRAEQAALEAEVGSKAVAAKQAYWKPGAEMEATTKEAITIAAARKIFLDVVDKVSAPDYEFFRLKLSC